METNDEMWAPTNWPDERKEEDKIEYKMNLKAKEEEIEELRL